MKRYYKAAVDELPIATREEKKDGQRHFSDWAVGVAENEFTKFDWRKEFYENPGFLKAYCQGRFVERCD